MPDLPPPPPTLDPGAWETVTDDVEQGFTIAMPRGWRNRAFLRRNGPAPNEIATSTSPSGATSLFVGDPTLPMFVLPGGIPVAGAVVQPYSSVEQFLPSYVQRRFGGAPGFRPVGMAPCPELWQLCTAPYRRSGLQAWVTAGKVRFEHMEAGRRVHTVVLGACTALAPIWSVQVAGVSTTDDPEPYVDVLLGMLATKAATPEMHRRQMQERAQSAAHHQGVMRQLDQNAAMLRANHEQSMATLRGMAASHQAHMDALHAANDAQHATWRAGQRAMDDAHASWKRRDEADDLTHRRIIDGIREERTVEGADGTTWQVADGYDRYFRRRSDGTWIGTKNQRDLSGLPGVDPAEYDEVRIKV